MTSTSAPASPRKVELSDADWMALLDAERKGLEYCCANVSNLRDVLVQVVRNGCTISNWLEHQLHQGLTWVLEGHEASVELRKFIEAAGYSLDELRSTGHERQGLEV